MSLRTYVPEAGSPALVRIIPAIAGGRRAAGPARRSRCGHEADCSAGRNRSARPPPGSGGTIDASHPNRPAHDHSAPPCRRSAASVGAATGDGSASPHRASIVGATAVNTVMSAAGVVTTVAAKVASAAAAKAAAASASAKSKLECIRRRCEPGHVGSR
jgi:hypothetical protein